LPAHGFVAFWSKISTFYLNYYKNYTKSRSCAHAVAVKAMGNNSAYGKLQRQVWSFKSFMQISQ